MANISKIKLPSGVTYDVVDEKSGYITSASLPTKTSDLTNDSGFITSYIDTKNTAGSTYTSSQLYLIGAMTQEENPQTYSNSNLYYYNGLVSRGEYQNYISDINQTGDQIGLYTIDQSSGNESGILIDSNGISIYSDSGHVAISGLADPINNTDAANKKYVDDSIATIPAASITLNGTSTTSASFYAPTAAGTSGYVLKSNGSGAPTWVSATLTDTKVTQTAESSESTNRMLLMSTYAPSNNVTHDGGAKTSSYLYFQPSTGKLTAGYSSEQIVITPTSIKMSSSSSTAYSVTLKSPARSSGDINVNITLPSSQGTLALTSDIPTNWLNGSATGSVRTSGSTTEDSNYTIGDYAVAEGQGTKASGNYSHAEGHGTTASSADSHAEGLDTAANAIAAHAEGGHTIASGTYSHAGGAYTTAQRKSQTVIGEYNVLDTAGNSNSARGDYAFIIGNGTINARSNALAVKWDGTVETAKGNLSGVQIVRW